MIHIPPHHALESAKGNVVETTRGKIAKAFFFFFKKQCARFFVSGFQKQLPRLPLPDTGDQILQQMHQWQFLLRRNLRLMFVRGNHKKEAGYVARFEPRKNHRIVINRSVIERQQTCALGQLAASQKVRAKFGPRNQMVIFLYVIELLLESIDRQRLQPRHRKIPIAAN